MAILTGFRIAVAALALAAHAAGALSGPLPIAQVKAGFLYNFALFVEWPVPPRSDAPLVIGVLGDEALLPALKQIEGRLANGRPIAVRALDDSDDPAKCAVLYIGSAEDRRAALSLSRVGTAPVLTVGESARFTQIGGIVRLYTDDGRLRFEINVTRSHRAGIRISSKLLGLARVVEDR